MTHIIRICTGFVFVAISLFLISKSLSVSSANTSYYRALSLLSINSNEKISLSALNSAKTEIQQSLQELPQDPKILTAAGRIDFLLATYEDNPEERTRLLNSSQQFHRDALKQRPFWAYSEINILFAKHANSNKVGPHDLEFQQRFANAILLAPDDKRAIKDLTEIAIMSWSQLSLDNQTEALVLVESSLKHKLIATRSMANSMRQQGSFYQICSKLKQFQEKRELCN